MNIDQVFEDVARQLTTAPFTNMGGGGGSEIRLDNTNEKKGCAC